MANRSPSAAATDTLIGQTIGGQYTLQRFLGHGSKARVFLATHRTLHRSVVVHLLSVPWADDTGAVAKFEEQARALRGLEHPNIAAVIDFGREPGRVFVVGEYVEGQLLATYVQQLGHLTLEVFVPIAAQILKGLGATHARGLVHRDLKPSNLVLVEDQGRTFVKILDLGLAQILEGPPRAEDAPLVGTADYLAPEQIMNKPVDARTDVYALGVLFYQMLAGQLPFKPDDRGSTASVLYKHVNDKPILLTEALPPGSTVPEGLIELIHDCLAKNPDNRPADANEIVERMIDSVPAALFRLPIPAAVAAVATATRAPEGERVRVPTGEFARVRAPTGDFRVRAPTGDFRVPVPRPEPLPQHDRALAAAVEASGLRPVPVIDTPMHGTPMHAAASQTSESGGRGSSWVLGLLALLLTSGLVYVYIQSQNNAIGTPTTAPDPAQAAAEAGLIKARELEEAGKLQDAVRAYEAVLFRDPSNAQARERVAALKAMLVAPPTRTDPSPDTKVAVAPGVPVADPTAGEPRADPTAAAVDPSGAADTTAGNTTAGNTTAGKTADTAGEVKPEVVPPKPEPVHVEFSVEATPRAEVTVDGVSKGKTPQKLDLLAGPHKFELKAPGFILHEETIEVAADGQKSLKVKLVRRTGGGGSINKAEEDAASAQLDPENDAPTTKIEVPLKR